MAAFGLSHWRTVVVFRPARELRSFGADDVGVADRHDQILANAPPTPTVLPVSPIVLPVFWRLIARRSTAHATAFTTCVPERALANPMVRPMRSVVFVAALMAGALNPYAPPTIDLAKLNTDLAKFSETSVAFISKTLTPVKPEAAPFDPVASARVDEDLDYRIAEQTKSVDGWRAFLAAHPEGAHAPTAQAELDKLQPPPAPPVAEVALNPPSQQFEFFRMMERLSAEAPEASATTTMVEVPVPETKTIVKWRERPTRLVVNRRVARPRHQSAPSGLPPFLMALFGGPRPRNNR